MAQGWFRRKNKAKREKKKKRVLCDIKWYRISLFKTGFVTAYMVLLSFIVIWIWKREKYNGLIAAFSATIAFDDLFDNLFDNEKKKPYKGVICTGILLFFLILFVFCPTIKDMDSKIFDFISVVLLIITLGVHIIKGEWGYMHKRKQDIEEKTKRDR